MSELDPEAREALQSWMFPEELGIINNDTRTYTPAFYIILEAMPLFGGRITAKNVCLVCNDPSAIWFKTCFAIEEFLHVGNTKLDLF